MSYKKYNLRTGITKLKTKTFVALSTLGLVLGGGGLSLALFGSAHALPAPVAVYDALPSVTPATNYPSLGFQATQTSEFGDYVHLGGTARTLNSVTVTMSDWALYSQYSSDERYSSDNVNWTHPITLNVYNNHLDGNGTPDQQIATVTQTVSIPWRPAEDLTCPTSGGVHGWRDSTNTCVNGLAFNATFDLSSLNVTLPNDVIVSVAYNTETYGTIPIGQSGPYNSLNVAVPNNQTISAGSDDNTDAVYWNSSTGTGSIFRQDTGWTPNGTVAIQINATAALVAPPTSKDQCKNNGWATFNNPSYSNQGLCVSWVEHNVLGHGTPAANKPSH